MPTIDDRDFTDLDGPVIEERLKRAFQTIYPDYDPSRISPEGQIFAEMGTVGERCGFYGDANGREAFVVTAVKRQSLLNHGVLVGFTPTSRVAARADVEFTLTRSVVPGARVLIPAGFAVSTAATAAQVTYETLSDLEILPDGGAVQSASTTAEDSRGQADGFQATGEAFQSVALTHRPYLDGSLVLVDDLGVFSLVPTFVDSGPSDAHAVLLVDAEERVRIKFGNGTIGRLPSGQISASYRVGGGVSGSVTEGQLRVPGSAQLLDDDGNQVSVTVTNSLASTAGAGRQSIEELRREIPQTAQSPQRTVSRPDFENNARSLVAGVARVIAVSLNEAPSLVPLNETWIYVVPKGGGVATQALLDEVAAIFADDGPRPSSNTGVVRVFPATYKTVDVRTRVYRVPTATREAMRAEIEQRLAAYFDPENTRLETLANGTTASVFTMAFGLGFADETGQPDGELGWAAILCEVEDSATVAKVDDSGDRLLLNGFDSDVSLGLVEFPALGTVEVVDAETGTVI